VCAKLQVLEKFSDDAKKPMHIDITIEKCDDFKDGESN
jgi:predicted component of type VI protein secretion system